MLDQFAQIPDKEKAKKLENAYHQKLNEVNSELELQRTLNLKYRYIRIYPRNTNGAFSVSFGWKRQGDEIIYAVALQSKKDNFSRKDAKKVINKRFFLEATHKFTFISSTHIRDIGPILAAHYNSLRKVQGVLNVPKYLRHIPIWLGW